MSVQRIHTSNAPEAIGPYSQGIIANGFLFTAGQIALDPATGQIVDGDVVVQTRRVMSNLRAILDEVGATWSDIVKTTVFMKNLADFPSMNEVYAEAMGGATPARSTVQVSELPRGSLVEIEMVVALK